MMNNRNSTIDIARGIGLIMVSVYHLVYRAKDGLADQAIREFIWLILPLFFFMSGLFYNSGKRSLLQNILHRIKTLLIPTLKYTVILLLIGCAYCTAFHGYQLRDWVRDFVFTYLRPEFSALIYGSEYAGIAFENISAVWFVWVMLFTYPVFYFLVEHCLKSLWNLIICVIALLALGVMIYDFGPKISWSLTLVPVYAAITLSGAYISNQWHNIKRNTFIALLAVIIHVLMFQLCGSDSVYASEVGTIGKWSVITFFLQTFIGGYALLMFCKALTKFNGLRKILTFIGRNSLSFLMLHCYFGVLFADLMHTYIKPGPNWYIEVTSEIFVKSLIGCLLSLICCSAFCIVKERIKSCSQN